jgi:hypothetical protein
MQGWRMLPGGTCALVGGSSPAVVAAPPAARGVYPSTASCSIHSQGERHASHATGEHAA